MVTPIRCGRRFRVLPGPCTVILVAEQPSYVPWVGYFDLMAQADVWVWYDDVQYTRRDWRNRNRLAQEREPIWLTVPVKSEGRRRQRICDAEIDPGRPWTRKHLETFRHCCGRGAFFAEIFALYEDLLAAGRFGRLADLVIAVDEAIAQRLRLPVRFLRSSWLTGLGGNRQERLLSLCSALGAKVYLSGPAAEGYLEPASFAAADIELRYVVYSDRPYPRGPLPFVPRLSILDPLAWIGPEATAALLPRTWRSAAG